MSDGDEDDVDGVALSAFQPVAFQFSVGLGVSGDRFDGALPSEFALDGRRGDATSANLHAPWRCQPRSSIVQPTLDRWRASGALILRVKPAIDEKSAAWAPARRTSSCSGYIPSEESTACSCTVNCMITLAYGVIAEGVSTMAARLL